MVSNALERSKNTDNTESLASSDDVASVTNLVIASMVLCFLRNPYWLLGLHSYGIAVWYSYDPYGKFTRGAGGRGRSDQGTLSLITPAYIQYDMNKWLMH